MVILDTPSGIVILDAALSICPTLEVTVTDHPIETGGFVTDHALEQPHKIKVEGFLSETPVDGSGDEEQPYEDRDILKTALAQRDPCTVTDDTDQYDNMVLESLEFPRDGQTGYGVRFVATFKEARFVESKTVAVSRSPKPAVQSRGRQAASEADAPTQGKSKTSLRAIDDNLGVSSRVPGVATPK